MRERQRERQRNGDREKERGEGERRREREKRNKIIRFSLISKDTKFEDNKYSYSFTSFSPPFKASSYKTIQKHFQVPNIVRKLRKEIFGKRCFI